MATTKAQLNAQLRSGGRFEIVAPNVSLLPSNKGGGAEGAKSGTMEYEIATIGEVRDYLRGLAQRAYSKALGILGPIQSKALGRGEKPWVQLELTSGKIDSYVVLTDTKKGQQGALAIEYGREDYWVDTADGDQYRVPGMTGLAILHRAWGQQLGSLEGTGGGDIP